MKLLMLLTVVATAIARPQDFIQPEPTQYTSLAQAGIIRMEMSQNEDGSFQYGFETTDPIQQDVVGQIKQIGDKFGVVMQGSYSFVAKDENGNDVSVTVQWTADENGFQATGDSIPQAVQATGQAFDGGF